MTPDSPPLDLLVVGGLTIDRFADGSSVPGGSVLHIARAAAPRGIRVGVVTAAGPEPEAQAGLDELHRAATLVESSHVPATTSFRHVETADGRRLWLGPRAAPVGPGAVARNRIETRAILFAPLAGEVPVESLTAWDATWARGAILQGWLRTTDEGDEVRPLPLSALGGAVARALRGFDLLVASREDLLAEAAEPYDQLQSMRRAFGRRPTLVVTDGPNGAWIRLEHSAVDGNSWHIPVPRRVENVPTVGSGDVFAAFMLGGGWQRPAAAGFVRMRVELAMRVVAEMLEDRRV
jgi:sugar/nucleoside kinase (ribokinase family)